VKYTTKEDLSKARDPRALRQSAQLALNSSFSLNGFERNFYFENLGEGFAELGAISGIDSDIDARSFGMGDVDRDGDLDLVVKNLQRKLLQYFRNEMGTGNHRVFFALEGTKSNRDGIGTRFEIRHGGRFQMSEMRSANGFQSQSPDEVFFGLGDDARVDRLSVFWPSGTEQAFENLEADRSYTIHEEKGIVGRSLLDPRAGATELDADTRATIAKRTFFSRPRPAPAFEDRDADGALLRSEALYAKPLLVSFVKTWLPSIDEHLDVLEAIAKEHGLEVLLFVVDPADPQVLARCRERPFRVARCPYNRYAPAFAQQVNVLFPSTFLIVGGTIQFDLIGRLPKKEALEAVAETLGD